MTHVKLPNFTREVSKHHWGCFPIKSCSFVLPLYIREEEQTNRNKLYAATNKNASQAFGS